MSISNNYSPDKSLGNGVTTQFSGNWKVLNASYFRCALESVSTGLQTLLTLGVDYTLTFNDSGYTVTLLVAPTSADYVVRYRQVDLTQTDPYRTSKGFQGGVIENSFDKLTAIDQDQQDDIGRSLKFQVGSAAVDYTIDDPQDKKFMVWDVPNKKIVNSTADADEVVADAEAARDAAQLAQAGAETAEINAETAEQLAEDWATKTNGDVDGSEYSAKAYAIGGTGVTDTAGKGAAKEWATKAHGSTVDGSEYSAKHYSVEASNFAAAAASSAAEGLYNDVVTLTSADSPYTPNGLEEGTLFRLDMTSGAITINLSSLASYGEDMKFGFVKIDGTGNSATINRGGTDTINGATSASISIQFETHVLVGDEATGAWVDTVQATGIPDNSVTNAKLSDMAQATIKGRASSAGTGDPTDLSAAQVRTIIGNATDTVVGLVEKATKAEMEGETSNKYPDAEILKNHPGIAKAWVNISGTGTVSIRSSYNVSSIVDNGTGDYTVNFTNAMANTNYCIHVDTCYDLTGTLAANIMASAVKRGAGTVTASSCRVQCTSALASGSGAFDCDAVYVSIYGELA